MNYTLLFHPAVRKDLRRLNPQARKTIVSEVLPALAADPLKGVRLTGSLKKIWKYRVALFAVWYRIAYQVDTARQEIIVLAIGSRGGFYDRLSRRRPTNEKIALCSILEYRIWNVEYRLK